MSMQATAIITHDLLPEGMTLASAQAHAFMNRSPFRSESPYLYIQDIKTSLQKLQHYAERPALRLVQAESSEQDRLRQVLHLEARLQGLLAQIEDTCTVLDRLEACGG